MQEAEPLRSKLDVHGADAGHIAAGTVETGDKTDFDRVSPDAEDDRN
jgi:hypothetical protein